MIADGLKSHFTIMLYAGLATLVVLLFLLILRAVRREKLGALLPFFAIPVVLMGFPFLETIKISGDGVELTKYVRQLEHDPTNVETRARVEELLARMDSRPYQEPGNLIELARAHVVAGDRDAARGYVDQVLAIDPHNDAALELRGRLSTGLAPDEPPGQPHSDLGLLIERARVATDDIAAREQLHARLEALDAEEDKDPEILRLAVEGWAVLEERERARHALDVLREKDPDNPEVPGLMRRLGFTR